MEISIIEVSAAIVVLTGATKLFVPRKYTIIVTLFWGSLALLFYGLDPVQLVMSVAAAAGIHTVGTGIQKTKQDSVQPLVGEKQVDQDSKKEYML